MRKSHVFASAMRSKYDNTSGKFKLSESGGAEAWATASLA
jgi:hypothetical protein